MGRRVSTCRRPPPPLPNGCVGCVSLFELKCMLPTRKVLDASGVAWPYGLHARAIEILKAEVVKKSRQEPIGELKGLRWLEIVATAMQQSVSCRAQWRSHVNSQGVKCSRGKEVSPACHVPLQRGPEPCNESCEICVIATTDPIRTAGRLHVLANGHKR